MRTWDPSAALKRVRAHEPGPFDLDVEMQEEVFLDDWTIEEPEVRPEEKQLLYPIASGPASFLRRCRKWLRARRCGAGSTSCARRRNVRRMFGLMHYEKCRLTLQPLTLFRKDGPEHMMISKEKIDRKELLKALKF